ncbi:MAG: hypothetical protein ACLQBD_01050, partial [Syntrophobacteraceae bacterium]
VRPCQEAQMFRNRSGCSKSHEAFSASRDRPASEASCRGGIPLAIKGPDKTRKKECLYLQFLPPKKTAILN